MRRDARWLGTWERASAAYLGHLRRELARAGRHDARSRVAICCAARGETAGARAVPRFLGRNERERLRDFSAAAHGTFSSQNVVARSIRLTVCWRVSQPGRGSPNGAQYSRKREYPTLSNRERARAPGEWHCLARATSVRSASSPEPQPRWLFVTPRRVSPRSGRSRPRPRPARSARPRCARPRRRRSPSRVS